MQAAWKGMDVSRRRGLAGRLCAWCGVADLRFGLTSSAGPGRVGQGRRAEEGYLSRASMPARHTAGMSCVCLADRIVVTLCRVKCFGTGPASCVRCACGARFLCNRACSRWIPHLCDTDWYHGEALQSSRLRSRCSTTASPTCKGSHHVKLHRALRLRQQPPD